MKTRFIISALSAVIITALTAHAIQLNAQPDQPGMSGKATVTIERSTLLWRASKVLGKHHGTVEFRNGILEFQDGKLNGGRFEVAMQTIKNRDLENDKLRAKLEGHLKSDDFFSADKFPTATFTITRADYNAKATNGEPNYMITGDMKIKGISNKITFPATIEVEQNIVEARASIVLDRAKWDIRYGSGSFFDNLGDNMIHDEFTLDLDVKATI